MGNIYNVYKLAVQDLDFCLIPKPELSTGKMEGEEEQKSVPHIFPHVQLNVSHCFEDGIVNETLELSDQGSLYTADDTKQKGGKVYVMGNRALYTSEPGAYLHTYVPMATGWRVVTTEL